MKARHLASQLRKSDFKSDAFILGGTLKCILQMSKVILQKNIHATWARQNLTMVYRSADKVGNISCWLTQSTPLPVNETCLCGWRNERKTRNIAIVREHSELFGHFKFSSVKYLDMITFCKGPKQWSNSTEATVRLLRKKYVVDLKVTVNESERTQAPQFGLEKSFSGGLFSLMNIVYLAVSVSV